MIVHCWGGKPDYAWYPWAKRELEARGYDVSLPAMPETEMPKLDLWLPELTKIIGDPDEELVLIGHSIGCAAIFRYLESLQNNQKVGKVILVAGFTDDLGFSELKNFFVDPLNKEKIISSVKNQIVAIQSDDDPYVDYEKFSQSLRSMFNARVVTKYGAKHMSGPVDEKGSCTQLPEVVEAI